MSEKTLILHLPIPKTGSTAIQKSVLAPIAKDHGLSFNPVPILDILYTHLLKPNAPRYSNYLIQHLSQLDTHICWISDENILSLNSLIWDATLESMIQLLDGVRTRSNWSTRLFVVTRESDQWQKSALVQAKLNGNRGHSHESAAMNTLGLIHQINSSAVDAFSANAAMRSDYFAGHSDLLRPVLKEIQNDGYIPKEVDINEALKRTVRRSPSFRSAALVTRLLDPLFPKRLSDFPTFYARLAETGYPSLSPHIGVLNYRFSRHSFPSKRSHILTFFSHLVFNVRIHLVTVLARLLTKLGV